MRVDGPLVKAGPWRLEPVVPDLFRVHVPTAAWNGWFDARVERDSTGAVTALRIDGARARNLVFARLPPE